MILNTEKQRCFVHIPKCAGTSVRKVLSHYHDADPAYLNRWIRTDGYGIRYAGHLTAHQLKATDPATYALVNRATIYAVIRDPAERFMSAVYQYCFQELQPSQYISQSGLSNIVGELLRDLHKAFKDCAPLPVELTHFTPQVEFLSYPEAKLKLYPISDVSMLVRDFSDGLIDLTPMTFVHENQTRHFKNDMIRRLAKYGRRMLPLVVKQNSLFFRFKGTLLKEGGRVELTQAQEILLRDWYAEDFELFKRMMTGPNPSP